MGFTIKTVNPVPKKVLTEKQVKIIDFLTCSYSTNYFECTRFDSELDGAKKPSKDLPKYLYEGKSYKNFVPLAYRDRSAPDIPLHGFCGFIYSDGSDYGIWEWTYDDGVPGNVDLYVSPQGYRTPFRSGENLMCIQNIIIDLDCHDNTVDNTILNRHINDLVPKLLKALPVKPHFVHHTGRGLHLWYCIKPVHVSKKPFCLTAQSMLCTMIKKALGELDEKLLTVDDGTSNNLVGLFRIPFTYNTTAKRWSTGTLLSESRIDVEKLCKKLYAAGFRSYEHSPIGEERKRAEKEHDDYVKKCVARRNTKYYVSKAGHAGAYTPCFLYRKRVLDYILRTEGVYDGNRHFFMYLYAHVCFNLYDFDDAWEILDSVNDMLDPPLPYNDVEATLKTVARHRYRITEKGFFRILGRSKESIPIFSCIDGPSKKKKAKLEVEARKSARDSEIFKLHGMGLTVTDIARKVGCSRPTVYKVLSQIPFEI